MSDDYFVVITRQKSRWRRYLCELNGPGGVIDFGGAFTQDGARKAAQRLLADHRAWIANKPRIVEVVR